MAASDGAAAVSQGLVLHGAWVAAGDGFPARFALWGERACAGDRVCVADDITAAGGRSGEKGGAGATLAAGTYPAHPFAVSTRRLQGVLGAAVGAAEAQPWPLVAGLPSAGGWPLASYPSSVARDGVLASAGERAARRLWLVPALCFAAGAAAEVLLALGQSPPPDVVPAHDVRCWIAAARFGVDLLKRQCLAPVVERDERRGTYLARWRPLLDQEGDRSRLDALTWAMPASSSALAWDDAGALDEAGALTVLPAVALRDFLHALVDGVARAGLPAPDVLSGAPAGAVTTMGRAWLAALSGDPVLHGAPPELDGLACRCRDWLAQSTSPPTDQTGQEGQTEPAERGGFRVCFRLEPPFPALAVPAGTSPAGTAPNDPDAASPIQESRRWTLRYLLQAADDRSLLLPAALVWREASATLRLLDRALEHPQEHLLRALGRAAHIFPPIAASLASARPEGCALTADEAHTFIGEVAAGLSAMGFGVLVPAVQTGLALRCRLRPAEGDQAEHATSNGRYGILNRQTLVRYDWRLALGDAEVTREEFEALARLKVPLVRVRGRWVELRPEEVARALTFFRRQPDSGEVGVAEALKLAIAPAAPGFGRGVERGETDEGPNIEVNAAGWLEDLLRLSQNSGSQEGQPVQIVDDPPGFVGQLRPYQKAGVAWPPCAAAASAPAWRTTWAWGRRPP